MRIFTGAEELGKAVETVRKRQGATQVQLAQMSHVGVRFVRDLEDGKKTVRLDKVMRVLSVLGIALAFDLPPDGGDV